MAFNPLLFVGATAGVGAVAGLAAATVASGGSLPSLPNLPSAGSIGRLFSNRTRNVYTSAEWLQNRSVKVNADETDRLQKIIINREQRFGNNIPMVYPEDLGKHFFKMTFSKYERSTPAQPNLTIPEKTIFLPIPANLKDATSLQYNHNPLGFLPGAGEMAYEKGLSEISVSGREGRFIGSQYMGVGLAAAASVVKGLTPPSGGMATALSGLSTILGGAAGVAASEGVRRAFSAQMGLALNPFNAVTFENVNFKQHQFTWKFLPKTEQESKTLKQIRTTLKKYALPAKSDLTFEYPYTVSIQLHPTDEYLYTFKKCFLTSFMLDYTPSQIPAFYYNNAPVEVVLSMNFIETEIWTSNDFGREQAQQPERGNSIPPGIQNYGQPVEGVNPGVDPGSIIQP